MFLNSRSAVFNRPTRTAVHRRGRPAGSPHRHEPDRLGPALGTGEGSYPRVRIVPSRSLRASGNRDTVVDRVESVFGLLLNRLYVPVPQGAAGVGLICGIDEDLTH